MVAIEMDSSMEARRAALVARFRREFGARDGESMFAVSIPLRLCPLGAHSDHQGGNVTGFAIDRSIDLVGAVTEVPRAQVASTVFGQRGAVDYAGTNAPVTGEWLNYLRGAVVELSRCGITLKAGINAVVDGAMPIGGLSSSAAVSIAYLKALTHAQGVQLTNQELVSLVLRIENGYLGLHNGVLDQSVILFSEDNALTVIGCRDNSVKAVVLGATDTPWELLVVYSGLSRQLTATPFNQRVSECQAAARELLQLAGRVVSERPMLGEVPREDFEQWRTSLAETSRKRAQHFFEEQRRVDEGVRAWARGDIRRFGELITQSGHSSIVNYESGSPALISLYEILAQHEGVYGTRFCGGGFQGCCLALIDPAKRDWIASGLHEQYAVRHPDLIKGYSLHRCRTSSVGNIEMVK